MEQIIKAYGKFLLDGVVVVMLFTMLFGSLEDEVGNRGILHIIGAHLETGNTEGGESADLKAYQSESLRMAPVITYEASELVYTGQYEVSEYIRAVNDAGEELGVRLLSVLYPYGEEQLADDESDRTSMDLESPGIYTVKVSAVDAQNRKTVCRIQIPVNRREAAE